MSKKEFDLSGIGKAEPILQENLAPHTKNINDVFAERTLISYSNFPTKVAELAETRAKELGLTKKQFLWEAFKKMGVSLPEYNEIYRAYPKKK